MTIAFNAARYLAVVVVAFMATAATNYGAHALYRQLTVDNIQRVVTEAEVERFGRPGLRVISGILDLASAAWYAGELDLVSVQEWLGLEFTEEYDDQGNAIGSALTVAVIDLVDVPTADREFVKIRDEVFLVESEQGIGDRFAGLSPRVPGLHTIVLFRSEDKVIIMTTTTVEGTDPEPLLTSEGLVNLARHIAPRFER